MKKERSLFGNVSISQIGVEMEENLSALRKVYAIGKEKMLLPAEESVLSAFVGPMPPYYFQYYVPESFDLTLWIPRGLPAETKADPEFPFFPEMFFLWLYFLLKDMSHNRIRTRYGAAFLNRMVYFQRRC